MKKLGRRRRARCSEVMRRRCAAYLRNLRRGRGGSAEAMFGSKTILKSVSPMRTLKLSPCDDLSDARFRLYQRRFFATTLSPQQDFQDVSSSTYYPDHHSRV